MYFVGIDVAKSFHVVSIVDNSGNKELSKPLRIENSQEGYTKLFEALIRLDQNRENFLVGLEATGIYGENLFEALLVKGYNVALLNPFQVRRYREQITMKQVKTDAIDSYIIALFLKSGHYSNGYITDEEYQSLRSLYRNRGAIMDDVKELKKRILTLLSVVFPEFEKLVDPFSISGMALLEKYPTALHYKHSSVDRVLKLFRHIQGNNFNQEKAQKLLDLAKSSVYSGKAKEARAIAIRSSLRLLASYQKELALLEEEIIALLEKKGVSTEEEPDTSNLIENLKTIPGVSHKSIAAVISECGDLRRFQSATKFIGYIGLFPTEQSSGKKESSGHLSKRGSSLVKHALYMASVSALIHNHELKLYYDTKRSQGKSKKEALIAVARKLATIIYSIFKYNTPYNPARVFSKV